MPTLVGVVKRFTNQKLVYWKKTGSNAQGKPVFSTPIQVDVRWEDKEQEIILPDGRKVFSHGYVITSTELDVGSLIWQGGLVDWQKQSFYPALPSVLQGGREILKNNGTPGLKQLPGIVYEVYF